MPRVELPSWAEWKTLTPDQKEYHDFHWKKGVNDRLDCLEQRRQNKALTAVSAFSGGVVAVACVTWAKGSAFINKISDFFK